MYLDSSQVVLKYLKDIEVNIRNILIIIKDFNIKDSSWDSNFLHHSIHSDILMDIVNSSYLELSMPTNQVSIRYLNNQQDLNLVINLMFLRLKSLEFNNYSIYPDWRLTLNYAPLTITIAIFEEHVQTRKYMIVKNSKEEENFVNKLIGAIKGLNTKNIQSKEVLEHII